MIVNVLIQVPWKKGARGIWTQAEGEGQCPVRFTEYYSKTLSQNRLVVAKCQRASDPASLLRPVQKSY